MNKTSLIIQIKYYVIIIFLIIFVEYWSHILQIAMEFPDTDLWMKLFVEEKMATIVEQY